MECALFRKDHDNNITKDALSITIATFMECALFRKDYDLPIVNPFRGWGHYGMGLFFVSRIVNIFYNRENRVQRRGL